MISGSVPAGDGALFRLEATPYERWHHQAASCAVCCEEEGRKTQQMYALTSLRRLLEVFIREELEFLTVSMYHRRLEAYRRRELRLTPRLFQAWAVWIDRGGCWEEIPAYTQKKDVDISPPSSKPIIFGMALFSSSGYYSLFIENGGISLSQ